jgi:transcriptional regulator with XRE-family HTH domain
MPAEPGPAVRRRQLGRQLRDLRIGSGLKTIKAAADRTGLSTATISRIESAKQTITDKNVRLMCQAYGVGAPLLDTLLRLARESDDRGWLLAYSDTVPDWFTRFVGEEADASEIWNWEIDVVPGLLQTADYMRAIALASGSDVTESNVRTRIALRQARQEQLASSDGARLIAIIGEGALRTIVGSRQIMRQQIEQLIEATRRANVTIHVLPFTAGAHPGVTSFAILHFAADIGDPTVFVEVDGGALYPDRSSDFDRYAWMFERLRQQALSPEETISLLGNLAAEL